MTDVRVHRPGYLKGVELLSARFRGHAFARHWHETLNFGVVERGANFYWHRGSEKVAGAGAVNLMNPGEIHDGRGDDWSQFMLHVEPDAVREVCADRLPYFRETVIEDAALAGLLRRTHAALRNDTDPLAGQSLFTAALAALVERHGGGGSFRSAAADPRVRRMRAFIHDNLGDRISLDDIADVGGLGRFHALRTFRDAVGLPPHAYLRQCRVHRAAALLGRGVAPVEAAAVSGFADQSHLNRAFKTVYGMTPGAYLRKQ